MKSITTWLAEGDQNTKFFHRYASHRKSINTIHEVRSSHGIWVNTFKEKTKAVVEHFQDLFKEPAGCPIGEMLEVLDLFPRAIIEEMNDELTKDILEEEIKQVLHSFQKGKSPSLDGLTLEVFLGFYDLIKKDILALVQESRKSRKLLGSMNSTFIALIPKKQKCEAFEDYRPISCCNMIYKMIAKIIAQRIKPILSKVITEDQFGFLQNKKILDAVSIAQEVIDTIKREKQSTFSLKLDLSKAYDRVS